MVEVVRRLVPRPSRPAATCSVVGHAPSESVRRSPEREPAPGDVPRRGPRCPALPEDFEAVVVEQRPRTVTRDGRTFEIDDSTLLARHRP